jgi:hypothetical protein
MSGFIRNRRGYRRLSVLADWFDISEEIENADARTTAIVAAAYVENNLVLAIMHRLRSLSEDDQKLIFENDHAALRDLSAKIDMGYALAPRNTRPGF